MVNVPLQMVTVYYYIIIIMIQRLAERTHLAAQNLLEVTVTFLFLQNCLFFRVL